MASYLIAIAVGELETRPVGDRTAVWAEPEVVDKAAHEFAEMEDVSVCRV
jgi:leukotriene-A4 hydrolase